MTERTTSPDPHWIAPADAAAALGITVTHLARLADRGEVDVLRRPSGHRRYSAESIEALLARAADWSRQ